MGFVVGVAAFLMLLATPQEVGQIQTVQQEIPQPPAKSKRTDTRGEKKAVEPLKATIVENNSLVAESDSPIAAEWNRKITKHLTGINKVLQIDRDAVGIFDVQDFNDGLVGIGSITDYGFTVFHVYDPVSQKVLHSEARLLKKSIRESLTIFFIRKAPSERYSRIKVYREKDRAVLGWLGFPIVQ